MQARGKFESLRGRDGAPESFLAKVEIGLGRTELTLVRDGRLPVARYMPHP